MDQLTHRRDAQCPAILVGGRIDRGAATLLEKDIEDFCSRHNISGNYVSCSAHTGEGLSEVMKRIISVVKWKDIATPVTPTFNEIRQFILSLKEQELYENDKVLITPEKLREKLNAENEERNFCLDDVLSAIQRLETHGHIMFLTDSSGQKWVLLHPNLLVNLASSFVDQARRNPKGLGALEEELILKNYYSFPELIGLNNNDINILLDATISLFIERNLCFRETSNNRTFLVFPTLIQERRPRIDTVETFDTISYKINGSIESTYATLVVLLGYTESFIRTNQWQDQARYELDEGEICGFQQIIELKGESILILNYAKNTPDHVQHLFQGYFEKFLRKCDVTITRYQAVKCAKCGASLARNVVMDQLNKSKNFTFCHGCGKKVFLPPPEVLKSQQFDKHIPDEPLEAENLRTAFEAALGRIKGSLRDLGKEKKPTCFISYAWGVPEHERWVLEFAKDLRKADVDVLLDRWHNPPGSDLGRYVDQILKSDFVLVIGTPALLKKYETQVSDPVVAAELRLINLRMREPSSYGQTVIPLLLDGDPHSSFIPLLQTLVRVDFRLSTFYFRHLFDMIWRLYNLPFDNPLLEDLQASMTPQDVR